MNLVDHIRTTRSARATSSSSRAGAAPGSATPSRPRAAPRACCWWPTPRSAAIPDDVTAIGGLTMGADAVAFGVAAIAATRGRTLRSFSVRKEAKDHGGGGRIAGALEPATGWSSSRTPSPAACRCSRPPTSSPRPAPSRCCCCRWSTGAAPSRPWPPSGVCRSWRWSTAPDLGFPYEGP